MQRHLGIVGILAIAIVALTTACTGNPTPAATTGTPAVAATTATKTGTATATTTQVKVTEKEFSIAITPASAKAGDVKFTVQNTGAIEHEFVVVKSDLDPAKLPVYSATDKVGEGHAVGDVNEDKITSAGEMEGIQPAASKDKTFTLTPGKYILICNLPSHYAAGMHVAFKVN